MLLAVGHETRLGLGALIAAKEEDPVLTERSADGEASFVPTRLRLVDAVLVIEEVVRVQLFVLEVEQGVP